MSYAMINRKEGKIVQVAVHKNALTDFVIVDLDKLDEVLTPRELRQLHKNTTGKNPGRKNVVSEIAKHSLSSNVGNIGSVQHARIIFDELKGKARSEVIEACVAAGINKNTASTQYHKWHKEQGPKRPTMQ